MIAPALLNEVLIEFGTTIATNLGNLVCLVVMSAWSNVAGAIRVPFCWQFAETTEVSLVPRTRNELLAEQG
jgi:hypothetical protein